MSAEKFTPHKDAPGAIRPGVERADTLRTVNAGPMSMADGWDDLFALFADDFSLETPVPERAAVLINVKAPVIYLMSGLPLINGFVAM